jgi:hypothetical protein
MAQVIEFYVPTHFKKRAMWVPHEQRGKVIAFRTDLDEITPWGRTSAGEGRAGVNTSATISAERREQRFFQYCCSEKRTPATSDIKPDREELA